MLRRTPDFILTGFTGDGGTVYLREPAGDRRAWTAYDVAPDGTLVNPRVVFGAREPRSWRGLAERQ